MGELFFSVTNPNRISIDCNVGPFQNWNGLKAETPTIIIIFFQSFFVSWAKMILIKLWKQGHQAINVFLSPISHTNQITGV